MSDTIRGGGHVGPARWFGYHATWPLASLTIERDFIAFRMWPINYKFERSTIVFLQKKKILGWPSLRIIHRNPAFSKSVTFQSFGFSAVESALLKNGYQITNEKPSPSATANIQYSNTIAVIACAVAILSVIAAIVAAILTFK
jgi:hypothetical protein